ncbi:MAG: prepilin-type N-terminal cleavage/methylation domain-containing protein [Acidobacteriota bacterium]
MRNPSREDGFTLTEMLVSTSILLLLIGAALTTLGDGMAISDAASQLSDSNQNLRAGTNQLVRDLLMGGRIIGAEGIAMPSGTGVTAFARPGPPGSNLTFSLDPDGTNRNLPSISTGDELGPTINGATTDIVTILTVDEFMPVITTPPQVAATPTADEGTISADGGSVTLPASSLWLTGDPANGTGKIEVGDLVFYKGPLGNAIQTVTSIDATHIYFAANHGNDWFHFNQPAATNRPLAALKGTASLLTAWDASHPVTLFRAMMFTYFIDDTTKPGVPRLTRLLNHCPITDPTCARYSPQALGGVVEGLDLTYDLNDGTTSPPIERPTLPYTISVGSVVTTYNSNQIRKVNVRVGVRSETVSKTSQDYVRNQVSTSVIVRSLASVDRYKTE